MVKFQNTQNGANHTHHITPYLTDESEEQTERIHTALGTRQGGWCHVNGLNPRTDYLVYMRSFTEGYVFGPVSGPVLRFSTKSYVPEEVRYLQICIHAYACMHTYMYPTYVSMHTCVSVCVEV